MTAIEALRKYPGLLQWMVVSFSLGTGADYEVEIHIVGPLKGREHDETCIREMISHEDAMRIQDASSELQEQMDKHHSGFFAPMCACLVDDCLITWEEHEAG